MRIKNWSKATANSWRLNKKPDRKTYAHTVIAVRKSPMGGYVIGSEHKILKRAKTKKDIYKKAVIWMRKHPNG